MKYLLLCLISLPLLGQDSAALEPREGETLLAFTQRIQGMTVESGVTDIVDSQTADVAAAIEAQPTAAGPQDAVTDQGQVGVTDFLPYLQFAYSNIDTSDDNKSITVKWNPLKVGKHGAIALTTSLVTEPEAWTEFLNEIQEGDRETQKAAIEKTLTDTSDVTWAVSYGFQRSILVADLGRVGTLWGRNYELYKSLIYQLDDEAWGSARQEENNLIQAARASGNWELELDEAYCKKEGINPGDNDFDIYGQNAISVKNSVPPDLWNNFVTSLNEQAAKSLLHNQKLGMASLQKLPALINNQPQLTFTATHVDRDPFVGRTTTTANLNFEMGSYNFNKVLRAYRDRQDPKATFLDTFTKVVNDKNFNEASQGKWAFSASYKKEDAYDTTHSFTPIAAAGGENDSEMTTEETVTLKLEETESFSWKLTHTRNYTGWKVKIGDTTVNPSMDFSLEYVDVSNDSMQQDRMVGRLSLILPLASGTSLPLTISYANHSRYLGEPDDQLNAHLGLSYKFSRVK